MVVVSIMNRRVRGAILMGLISALMIPQGSNASTISEVMSSYTLLNPEMTSCRQDMPVSEQNELCANVTFVKEYGNGNTILSIHKDALICTGDYILPLVPTEILWSNSTRAILYALALCYCFLGVAIISDIFMAAIEVITAKEVTIHKPDENGEMKSHKVLFWNETIANLSLMALGSSAPEILLNVVETCSQLGQEVTEGGLGPSTIVGSAAYNLLVITGICISAIPDGEKRIIDSMPVFKVTAFFSVFAYVWILLCLSFWTPDEITLIEAFLTLILFFVLVGLSYAADRNWFGILRKEQVIPEGHVANTYIHNPNLARPPGIHAPYNKSMVANLVRNEQPIDGESPEQLAERVTNQILSETKVSRLRYRINAMRSLTGGKRVIRPNKLNSSKQGLLSKLGKSIRGKIAEEPPEEEETSIPISFLFSTSRYDAFENDKYAHVTVIRTRKDGKEYNIGAEIEYFKTLEAKKKSQLSLKSDSNNDASKVANSENQGDSSKSNSNESTTTSDNVGANTKHQDSKFDLDEFSRNRELTRDLLESSKDQYTVRYETSNGAAVAGEDFEYTSGMLAFGPHEYVKTIRVPIIDDNEYEPNENFFITLKNPSANAVLGTTHVAEVMIIDDDTPGTFEFSKNSIVVKESEDSAKVKVKRTNGCDGTVKIKYCTKEGTAKDGVDYHSTQNVLVFLHGETEKEFEVKLINKASYDKESTFVTEFEIVGNPSNGTQYGANKQCAVTITSDDRFQATVDQVALLMNLNLEGLEVGTSSWAEQFRNALTVQGEDGDEPSTTDYALHGISLFWKVLFALVPPTSYCGGWLAFVTALIFIGLVTMVVGDLAGMFGCCIGISKSTTAITFVALGTSLPDTFASKTAAENDKYADASVGNVTGSNSVNVFLGLGLPWVIASLYHASKGTTYEVKAGAVATSVTTFCMTALCCISLLLFRRYQGWGELGGPKVPKIISSLFCVALWGIYVSVSIFLEE